MTLINFSCFVLNIYIHIFAVLAAWFRLKYPHVVLGSLASSAPILYFDDIVPQDGYYSVVTKDFKVKRQFFIFILYLTSSVKLCLKPSKTNYSMADAGN